MTPALARDDALLLEIHELASAGLRGEATPEQSQRLERLVVENPRARSLYVAYLQDTVTLEFWASGRRASRQSPENAGIPPVALPPAALAPLPSADDEVGDDSSSIEVQIRTIPRSRRRVLGNGLLRMGLAAAVVAAVTVGWSIWKQQLPGDAPPSRSFARLHAAAGVVWGGPEAKVDEGLPAGRLRLESGFAELEFDRGAVVIVEGPADFEVLAADRLQLFAGQLTAQVAPAARGFTVVTPQATLVDLGTEFGVISAPDQPSELHVFRGRVEGALPGDGAARQAIEGGAAARFDAARRQIEAMPLDAARFARFMPVPGLWGEYFNERELTDRTTGRVDPQIDFTSPDWDLAPPETGVTPDGIYSQRWTGFVRIERAGRWTFSTTSNDGVRLWIGEELLIDRWDTHVDKVDLARVTLAAGWHPIRLEHFQDGKDAGIVLRFAGPGQAEAVIPTARLSVVHPATGDRADR